MGGKTDIKDVGAVSKHPSINGRVCVRYVPLLYVGTARYMYLVLSLPQGTPVDRFPG